MPSYFVIPCIHNLFYRCSEQYCAFAWMHSQTKQEIFSNLCENPSCKENSQSQLYVVFPSQILSAYWPLETKGKTWVGLYICSKQKYPF